MTSLRNLTAVAVWGAAFWLGCGPSEPSSVLRDMVPRLDPEVARVLESGSDVELTTLAQELGAAMLLREGGHIHAARVVRGPEQAHQWNVLTQFLDRLRPHVSGQDADCPTFPTDGLSAEQRAEFLQHRYAFHDAAHANRGDDSKLLAVFQEEVRVYQEFDQDILLPHVFVNIARSHISLGDRDAARVALRKALRFSRACDPREASHVLGMLGDMAFVDGSVDSMGYFWDQAKQIAQQSRLGDSVARIDQFYASHYRDLGRFADAEESYRSALAAVRQNGGTRELRFLGAMMDFYSELGCWRAVDRLSRRASIVADQSQADEHRNSHFVGTLIMELRLQLRRGNQERASQLLEKIERAIASHAWNIAGTRLSFDLGRVLYEEKKFEESIAHLERAREHSLVGEPVRAARASVYLAGAYQATSEPSLAEERLQEFREYQGLESFLREWVLHDAIQLRIAGGEGRAAIARALRTSLDRVDWTLQELSPTPHTYLFLESLEPLRVFIHELLETHSHDAVLDTFRFESAWRRLARVVGRNPQPGLDSTVDPLALVRQWTENHGGHTADHLVKTLLEAHDAQYVLFDVRTEEVVRWVYDRDGLEVTRFEQTAEDLESDVRTVLAQVPSSGAGPDSAPLLRISALLPQTIAPSTFITADGVLRQIPFGLLSSPGEPASKMVDETAIAYVRFLHPSRPERSTGAGLIVAAPSLAPELRLSSGLPPLRESSHEVQSFRSLDREATVLTGPSASKQRVLEQWEGRGKIFFATHVVRDPDIPFITYIPLASASTSPDARLDIADIRSADMSGCELVTLSTCSSGECYVEEQRTAPSLGDAFIDAGAQTVIQTYWGIEDDFASRVSALYTENLRSGMTTMHAVARAQRTLRDSDHSASHWAAHAVQTTDPLQALTSRDP